MPIRTRRLPAVLLVSSLVALLAGAAVATAQTDGQIHVSAGVVDLAPITQTICDNDAAFGTNLDANGAASDSGDDISVLRGEETQNQGAVYQWDPACAGQPSLLQVSAPRTWTGNACATETSGANSLSVAGGGLRYSPYSWISFLGGGNTEAQLYGNALSSLTPAFPVCGIGTSNWTTLACTSGHSTGCGAPGGSNHNFFHYLHVARNTTAGAFDSTTTWAVISG